MIANRLWQWHFGRGLVRTSSDFGRLGEPPSHPELLDYLARRFVGNNWSIKYLHRLILLSSTYRQSSADNPAASTDPSNRLLWKFNRQRLALLLLTAGFIAALPWTGTTLGLFLVLIAGMWTLGVTSIRQLIGIAATTAATVYVLLIYLVSSRLPQGPVEWLIAKIFGIEG